MGSSWSRSGRAGGAQLPENSEYSSAESRSLGSSVIRTLKSQPPSKGAEFTREGSSTTSSLTSVTSPVTGEYRSLTDLVDSSSPQDSPAETASPTAGSWTKTTS